MSAQLITAIDAILPQTQCGKCGYNGCLPYAQALSQGNADINQCPPGGKQGIQKLAALLGVETKPLNSAFGVETPRRVAVINEAECVGCTKCLPPCPVDAIIGASKHMHTVIATQCTGCELCIAPCPVNCISMQPTDLPDWRSEDAQQAKQRYVARNRRLAIIEQQKVERMERQKQMLLKLKQAKTGA